MPRYVALTERAEKPSAGGVRRHPPAPNETRENETLRTLKSELTNGLCVRTGQPGHPTQKMLIGLRTSRYSDDRLNSNMIAITL